MAIKRVTQLCSIVMGLAVMFPTACLMATGENWTEPKALGASL